MPKKYRLSRADFLRLPGRGARRIHGSYFSLTLSPLHDGNGPKAASVVSKKIAAKAVDRNRIERYWRESARAHLAAMKGPLALVFHAKRDAAHASLLEIRKDVDKLFRQIA